MNRQSILPIVFAAAIVASVFVIGRVWSSMYGPIAAEELDRDANRLAAMHATRDLLADSTHHLTATAIAYPAAASRVESWAFVHAACLIAIYVLVPTFISEIPLTASRVLRSMAETLLVYIVCTCTFGLPHPTPRLPRTPTSVLTDPDSDSQAFSLFVCMACLAASGVAHIYDVGRLKRVIVFAVPAMVVATRIALRRDHAISAALAVAVAAFASRLSPVHPHEARRVCDATTRLRVSAIHSHVVTVDEDSIDRMAGARARMYDERAQGDAQEYAFDLDTAASETTAAGGNIGGMFGTWFDASDDELP